MNTPTVELTVDDAMSEFQAALRDALGDSPPDAAARPATPEEREEGLFRFAELVLSLACPDPRGLQPSTMPPQHALSAFRTR